MRIPISDLNQSIAFAAAALLALPTAYHLVADQLAKPGRDFSLIPHKKRHCVATLFRLGFIAGTAALASSTADAGASGIIWLCALLLLLVINAAGATDRRLTIDADSGLVRWRKISLPWWPGGRMEDGFVDHVSQVHFDSGKRKMNLLGVGELEQNWSVNYNGSVSSSGHYSEHTLGWIAQQVNDYLRAFRSHDTEQSRLSRRDFREGVLAARAPRLKREADRARRAEQSAADKESRKAVKEAARAASKEQARLRRVQQKFQQ